MMVLQKKGKRKAAGIQQPSVHPLRDTWKTDGPFFQIFQFFKFRPETERLFMSTAAGLTGAGQTRPAPHQQTRAERTECERTDAWHNS
jgi:hypothetical protein